MISLFLLSVLFLQQIVCFDVSFKKQVEHGEIQLNEKVAFKIYQENYFKNGKITDKKFSIFYQNLQEIVDINKSDLKNYWTAGINENTFLSEEEWNNKISVGLGQSCSATVEYQKQQELQKKLLKMRSLEEEEEEGLQFQEDFLTEEEKLQIQMEEIDYDSLFYSSDGLPTYFDWRDTGIISPVKDQQSCGSCWAFSATGALESHWSLHTGVSPPLLSEQQFLDCAKDFDNNGCDGGLPSHAFEYLKYNQGLSTETQYPYFAMDLFECKFDGTIGAYAHGGSFNITNQDEQQLKEEVHKSGPVSVAYTVTSKFRHYVGGVYYDPNCPNKNDNVNHAVLAIGWGKKDGHMYWILKNSWGPKWGENGYFRMIMGLNMCGIADCASYPIIESQPEQI